jgi:DNA-binding HxlR family transcriptional regulator
MDYSVYGEKKEVLESRARLEIMGILQSQESYDFNSFKTLLNITDGNLATHLKTLEKASYIEVLKTFIGRKPNTQYKSTTQGRKAFRNHLLALEALIQTHKK